MAAAAGGATLTRWLALVASRDLARRDPALDALRAVMIIGMVWVNHAPLGGVLLAPFVHVPWHGWTLADTVFPGFLVAVGIAIHLARSGARESSPAFYGKVVRRFVLLQLLNVALINFPYYEFGKLQFSGTLAMIGWCYLVVALIQRHTQWRTQAALALGGTVVQAAIYALVSMPGSPPGDMSPEGNAARYLDRLFFVDLLGGSADGPLVLLPAVGGISTTLIGLLAGQWLRRAAPPRVLTAGLAGVAVPMMLAGLALGTIQPVNKALWTGGYTLLMAGLALLLLAALRTLDHLGARAALVPLQVAGANSLFFYVFAQGVQRVMVFARFKTSDGGRTDLGHWIYQTLIAPWAPGAFGTLIFTLTFLLFCYAVVLVLHKNRLYFRL